MRIMKRFEREIPHFRLKTVKSEYAGSETSLEGLPDLKGHIYHVSDERSIALYGERIKSMYGFDCKIGSDVIDGDVVEIDGSRYNVISVMKYSTHIKVVAERDGVYR